MCQNGLIIIKRNNYKLNIMKNIFLLPTVQPSRLAIQLDCKPIYNLQLSKIENNWTDNWEIQHIYITSDKKIEKGDWCYSIRDKCINRCENPIPALEEALQYKVIILTTDPTLIADGIQEIDDEFLEWFVKNPTCDFVEVKTDYLLWKKSDKEKLSDCYKITIPQEHPQVISETGTQMFFDEEANLIKETVGEKVMPLDNENIPEEEETLQILTEAKTGSLSECIKTIIDDKLNSIEEYKKLFSKEEVRNIAEWSFHFYQTNEYSDSELENEWYKLLEEKLNK